MRILPQPYEEPLSGSLVYRKPEYSFDFVPTQPEILMTHARDAGTTSIVIGTLQIEIAIASQLLLYVWGYHPTTSWRSGVISRPEAVVTALKLISNEPLIHGVSMPVDASPAWTTIHDPGSTWVQVQQEGGQADTYFEFATDTVAGLTHEGKLVELLLKPAFSG